MTKIKTKNILIGALVTIVAIVGLFGALGAKFAWSDYDLPEKSGVSFTATCNYYGIWYEKAGIRIIFFQSCSNI